MANMIMLNMVVMLVVVLGLAVLAFFIAYQLLKMAIRKSLQESMADFQQAMAQGILQARVHVAPEELDERL